MAARRRRAARRGQRRRRRTGPGITASAIQPDPLSGYVVHFVRGSTPEAAEAARSRAPGPLTHMDLVHALTALDETGFQVSLSVLRDGHVRATGYPMGVAREVPHMADPARSACFSETPLHLLGQLMAGRDTYGVGFPQSVLAAAGGRPVRYYDPDDDETTRVEAELAARVAEDDPDHPFWADAPCADITNPGNDMSFEQEWRVLVGFDFAPADVAFCFIPASLHANARVFFTEHERENTGPAYLGTYLDPTWSREQMQAAFAVGPQRRG